MVGLALKGYCVVFGETWNFNIYNITEVITYSVMKTESVFVQFV